MKRRLVTFLMVFASLSYLETAHANHGPGTTGGGASTISGETLKEGQFVFGLDHNYTNYENVSREQAEAEAIDSGEFDAIRDAFLTNTSFIYGISDDFQVETYLGWYSGRGFIDAHAGEAEESEGHTVSKHSALAESSTGSPEGLTDLALRAKYRLVRGAPGNLSVVGGVVFPTGQNNERLSDGDKLEPSSQPGTGAFGATGGVAYSRYLTSHVTFDISSLYTHRFEHADFRVGSRADTSVSFAYRLTDSIQQFPQVSIFAEATYVWLGKDKEGSERNENSGGDTVYLTPGARLRVSEQVALSLAPSFPVIQDLNGNQLETDFRVLGQLTVGL